MCWNDTFVLNIESMYLIAHDIFLNLSQMWLVLLMVCLLLYFQVSLVPGISVVIIYPCSRLSGVGFSLVFPMGILLHDNAVHWSSLSSIVILYTAFDHRFIDTLTGRSSCVIVSLAASTMWFSPSFWISIQFCDDFGFSFCVYAWVGGRFWKSLSP